MRKHPELKKYKYITALDKNQIPNMQNVNVERFGSINEEGYDQKMTEILEACSHTMLVLIFGWETWALSIRQPSATFYHCS